MRQMRESQLILPRETDINVAGNYWLLNYWQVTSKGLRDGCWPALKHNTKHVRSWHRIFLLSTVICTCSLRVLFLLHMTSWQSGLETTKIWNLYYLLDQGSCIRELMCVSVCHGIHCQVSDRFLFVHKLRSVISSIFETIKQRRENGWLGNPWILICQQNENESGRWWKCAEWEVAADVGKEQTFFYFFPFLYPTALIYCPPRWTQWERLTARGLKSLQIWMEPPAWGKLCELYFI